MGSAKQLKKAKKDGLDTLHKRRLMGFAVLIALAVIFLPLILDGSGTERELTSLEPLELEPTHEFMEEVSLPELSESVVIDFVGRRPQPGIDNPIDKHAVVEETPDIVIPVHQQILEPPKPTLKPQQTIKKPVEKTAPQTDQKRTVSKPKPKPITPKTVVVEPKTKKSFLIQAASFKDKINALSLRSELKRAGFLVKVKVGVVNSNPVFRVYVGPTEGRDAAIQLQRQVEKKLNRKTFLVAE